MYKARKEQSSKSYSRKLSQILMKKGRFSGLKPIYLLNHSFWLYTCHTFSESCVTKEDHGIEKMMSGVDLKLLAIFSLRTQTGSWSDTASYKWLNTIPHFVYQNTVLGWLRWPLQTICEPLIQEKPHQLTASGGAQ